MFQIAIYSHWHDRQLTFCNFVSSPEWIFFIINYMNRTHVPRLSRADAINNVLQSIMWKRIIRKTYAQPIAPYHYQFCIYTGNTSTTLDSGLRHLTGWLIGVILSHVLRSWNYLTKFVSRQDLRCWLIDGWACTLFTFQVWVIKLSIRGGSTIFTFI